jgi:hypothetical protein
MDLCRDLITSAAKFFNLYRIVPMQRNPPLRRNGVWGKGEA